jgi:hypothetical protein
MKTVLLVGGSADGELRNIPDEMETIKVVPPIDSKVMKDLRDVNVVTVTPDIYRQQIVSASANDEHDVRRFYIFTPPEMSTAEILSRLINGYRKPKELRKT